MVEIRRATQWDAEAAIETLRRSITELCHADHRNDEGCLAAWLGNKTVENWARWTARADAVVLVAVRGQSIVGVGMTTVPGEILLNYVHPNARFSGVSKMILAALEAELRAQDVRHCHLESTLTARTFYASCGYAPKGDGSLMTKSLVP